MSKNRAKTTTRLYFEVYGMIALSGVIIVACALRCMGVI